MKNKSELTIIIPFRNEGDEVERTIQSLRDTAKNEINILLVNDCSDDSYDYDSIAKKYDARQIELYKSIGPARARDVGVNACETEYFVLMDAHMRLYQSGWPSKVVNNLKLNPDSIICSATNDISKPETDETCSGGAYGAYVYFGSAEEYSVKWVDSEIPLKENSDLREVICVLGAFYASTKTHWKTINGLFGLDGFGFEEPWISIKTWLSGGKCFDLKDFTTGHLYRKNPPTKINYAKYYSNQILMNYFFTKDESLKKRYDDNLKNRIGEDMHQKAWHEFNQRKDEIKKFKNYFYQNIAKIPMNEFLDMNKKVSSSQK